MKGARRRTAFGVRAHKADFHSLTAAEGQTGAVNLSADQHGRSAIRRAKRRREEIDREAIHRQRHSQRIEGGPGKTLRRDGRGRPIGGATVLAWRAIAKDGMDLPADQATVRPAIQQSGNGETYDFEFTPTTPGDIRFTVSSGVGVLLVTMPIRVR